ncbi:hypothetical protein DENSPDRAFT_770847 [Dentipellis sp. KUC8613]|nr:hypothetical protein DENSPDRAFT_770847 [Dentipellis sp. KUC8613]
MQEDPPSIPPSEPTTRDFAADGGAPSARGSPQSTTAPSSATAAGEGPARPATGQEMSRPLNVTDALSYLDAVKVQFSDRPDVYNQFLDIMKDFKSQLIDTPGVIERVSVLFHGNPYLIQGFNTFLPPGYHINCTTDVHNVNLITVTTPMGTMTSSTNSLSHPDVPNLSFMTASPFAGTPLPPGSRPETPPGRTPLAPPMPPYPDVPQQAYSPGPPGSTTSTIAAAAASVLNNMGNKNQIERAHPAGEFDHAIQYLNKIKMRFPDDPNTYKQFLEILQTYRKEQQTYAKDPQAYQQREQRMMKDVYVQVQVLFKDATDLLAEFKDFLPEISGTGAPPGNLVGILPHPAGGPAPPNTNWNQESTAGPSSSQKTAMAPPKRRKREPAKESAQGNGRQDSRKRPRTTKAQAKGRAQSPTFNSFAPPSPQPGPSHLHPSQSVVQFPSSVPASHSHTTHPGAGISHVPGPSGSTADELMFFDRAKRVLESRETYEDFLKLLRMYAKDIIDTKQLVTHAQTFLGEGELLTQFKVLLSWDDKQASDAYGPPGSIRTAPPEPVPPHPDDGLGPSYRMLPQSEVRLATSGRDQLARSVLNDEWVSHPQWASEESGFVSHKKNSFEEVIHRCEDERHEYQIHIEGITRTISLLEPLCTRLEQMAVEERAAFKLKPDLGGPSKCIYQRTIKKVYGKDPGLEIYQALQDNPAATVPTVLARLKQKSEEWRRAQREWGMTWRQIEGKNFYKSLDHMGINFKANDKKSITTKSFVTEIENIKAEKVQARELDSRPPCTLGSPGPQLEYAFDDTTVLQDTLKLVYAYLDHNQATYSLRERRSVEKFLRAFVPTLFMFPAQEFNAVFGPWEPGHEYDSSDDQEPSADVNEDGDMDHSGGVHAADLRKKLLKTVKESAGGRKGRHTPASGTGSRAMSPATPAAVDSAKDGVIGQTEAVTAVRPLDVWVRESLPEGGSAIRDAPVKKGPFFVNTTFYTLLRLLQLVYSRLLICKEVGAEHAKQGFKHVLANPVAVELGLEDAQGPSAVLEQLRESVREHGASQETNVLYLYLLDACEKLFDNEMDQATFEEHMRWFFGTKSFYLYTVDKVIAALIKQVQTIVSDHKCQELWQFLRRARNKDKFTRQDIIRYRREAEHHVGSDDNLYRVDWDQDARRMSVQLVGADEASVDEGVTEVDRWREYVDSYVMDHPTEWVGRRGAGAKETIPIFVKRCVHLTPEDDDAAGASTVVVEGGLGVRVSLGSYKLFFEGESEESIWRERSAAELGALRERARAREEERRRSVWLEA